MITDARVFEDIHLPRELPHRNGELQSLARALDPSNNPAGGVQDVLVSGPSGVGKTALARHYLRRAERHDRLAWAHIPCLGETTGTILREALRDLSGQRVPSNMLVIEARRALANLDDQAVVVLDEADDLPETDVLEELATIEGLSVIAICHDRERWLSRLDSELQTRFRTVIEPDRYGVDELADILRPRARQGLEPNAIGDEGLRELADGSAGVARRGIQALRAAAELAAEREHGQIQGVDIADSFDRARSRIREANLGSLAYHHQVLYELIRQAGRIRMRELNKQYEKREEELYNGQAVTPISRRWRRERLPKLVEYDLVEREKKAGGTEYAVIDGSLESPHDPLARPN